MEFGSLEEGHTLEARIQLELEGCKELDHRIHRKEVYGSALDHKAIQRKNLEILLAIELR